jgi:hypothetical protein
MEDERQTERLYRKIDNFLKWTGLCRAAKGTPSLLAAILASIVALECIPHFFPDGISRFVATRIVDSRSRDWNPKRESRGLLGPKSRQS